MNSLLLSKDKSDGKYPDVVTPINKNYLVTVSMKKLLSLKQKENLYSAAPSKKTGYNKIWIRDNIYQALGVEKFKLKEAVKTYRAILDILKKYEWKINRAIRKKPESKYDYIHPVYTLNMSEISEEWGFKQNDAIGALLFKIGDLELKGVPVLRNKYDEILIQKLVYYLESIEYWHDKDNGMWEENEEVHASSVGACVAGLKKISKIVDVPKWLIKKGEKSLKKLLPGESKTKGVDLALLSLIYPYDIVDNKTAEIILRNVESKLVKQHGVMRYKGDAYYYLNGEAEWTMGFPWLAIIYKKLHNPEKYAYYMRKTFSVMTPNLELPELYLSNSDAYNTNTPLGWAQSLLIIALA